MVKNILLVGTGGQGTILASKLLTLGLVEAGYEVKMSEIHGMSQRGGSVSTHIRFGEQVESPVIVAGEADIIVSFEKMEALRWLKFLKLNGKIIVNDYEINPMPVVGGVAKYSPEIADELKKNADVRFVSAFNEAEKIGSTKVLNIILLGTVIEELGLNNINWEKIISKNVKSNFVEMNQKALAIGRSLVVEV